MQVDHDLNNKITITISQPIDRFQVDKISSKYPSNILFLHYDITYENPVTLSKQDQSLFMKIVGSLLFLSTRSRPDISFHAMKHSATI